MEEGGEGGRRLEEGGWALEEGVCMSRDLGHMWDTSDIINTQADTLKDIHTQRKTHTHTHTHLATLPSIKHWDKDRSVVCLVACGAHHTSHTHPKHPPCILPNTQTHAALQTHTQTHRPSNTHTHKHTALQTPAQHTDTHTTSDPPSMHTQPFSPEMWQPFVWDVKVQFDK